MEEFLKKLKEQAELADSPVDPKDETTFDDAKLRNVIIQKLGLPDTLKQSVADEKRFSQNFPRMVAEGTVNVAPGIAKVMKFDKLKSLLKQPGEGRVMQEAAEASYSPAQRALTQEEQKTFQELISSPKNINRPFDEVAARRAAEEARLLQMEREVEEEVARMMSDQSVSKAASKKTGSFDEITKLMKNKK